MKELGKWPRLLVEGHKVTSEQAAEIIVRTDNWYLCTNDKQFEREIYEALGIGITFPGSVPNSSYFHPKMDDIRAFKEDIEALELNYLENSRIVSSWIGGPHGWCDWDGTIGSTNYNLGKWPDVDAVTADWQQIIEAFPFLSLRAQLVGNEGDDEEAAVEWEVSGTGVWVCTEPAGITEKIQPRENEDAAARGWVAKLVSDPYRERGCLIEELEVAVDKLRYG